MTPQPHVSAALVQLRRSVSIAAGVFIVCATVHLLVFGFVHFTDARWETAQPQMVEQPPSVVQAGDRPRGRPSISVTELENQPKVLSRYDAVLREFSDVSLMGGIISTAALCVFIYASLVIAGGSSIPGVEHVVRSATWATVLAGLALPWADVFSSLPFRGSLMNYGHLVAASEAVNAGDMSAVSLIASGFVAPLASIGIVLTAVVHMRLGVASGIIANSVNEFDEAIEKEIREIQKKGIGTTTGGRAVGALQRAVGDGVTLDPPPMKPREDSLKRSGPWSKPGDRSRGPEDGIRRPL